MVGLGLTDQGRTADLVGDAGQIVFGQHGQHVGGVGAAKAQMPFDSSYLRWLGCCRRPDISLSSAGTGSVASTRPEMP